MAKDKNIVSRKDQVLVGTYIFSSHSNLNSKDITDFMNFWDKYIKGKSIPFGNINILKIIMNKYVEHHKFENLSNHYVKFESLYLKLNPDDDKDIEIFLNLCDILIYNINEISIESLIRFYNLFQYKDSLLKMLNYITESQELMDNIDSITNILERIRKYIMNEEEFCQITLFVFYQILNGDDSILNIDWDNFEDDIYNFINNTLINNNYNDKLDILEKLKSLRDKYKYIEKKNDILSKNIDKYSESLNDLITFLEKEYEELKKHEQIEETSNSIEQEYLSAIIGSYTSYKNEQHNKFELMKKNMFMNNYVCLSGPKECGKRTMINEFEKIFDGQDFISCDYEDLLNIDYSDIYDYLIKGVTFTIEIDKTFIEKPLIHDLINASKNLNKYIKIGNKIIKISPNFKLCIINHNNKEFRDFIKEYSIVNIECDYDEELEEKLTSEDAMNFFKEYRKDLKVYDINLTTKDIVNLNYESEVIELFERLDQLVKKHNKEHNNYINLTQNYDPSNILYNLFNEWQQEKLRLNNGISFNNKEHGKTLIKRLRK